MPVLAGFNSFPFPLKEIGFSTILTATTIQCPAWGLVGGRRTPDQDSAPLIPHGWDDASYLLRVLTTEVIST